MNRRHLPGYYFDEEKGKFFRILPNHNAPTGNPYTRDKVALAQRTAKRQKTSHSHQIRDETQRVRTPKIFNSAVLSGAGLFREIDPLPYNTTQDARRTAFVKGLTPIEHEVSPNAEVSCFTWDSPTSSALTSLGSDTSAFRLPRRGERFPSVAFTSLMRGFSPQEVSSMTLSPSRVLASTCIGSVTRSGVVLMKLTDAELLNPDLPAEFDLSIVYHYAAETTTWSSCANPFIGSQQTKIAVGTSKEVVIYTETDGHWDDTQRHAGGSDALDLAWLTSQTLAIGQRNGDLKLWDMRSQGSAIRLRKTGAICNIRRTGDNAIAIHGMNAIALFDLRMASKKNPRPIVAVDFYNGDGRPRGFDVDVELGLMANADDENYVTLYSLRDGRELSKLAIEQPTHEAKFGIRCLQFAKTDQGRDILLGSCAGSIVEWAW